MRVRGCIIVIVCVLSRWSTPATAQMGGDATTIRALESKWAESYKLQQFQVLSSLIADDYVITFEDGSMHSKVGLMSHLAQPSEHVRVCEFSDLKVRMHGDTAVVTGSYHEARESDGRRYDYNDRLTDVWMRIQGNWKLIASHYSLPAQKNSLEFEER